MVSAELNLDNIKAIFQKYWKVAIFIVVFVLLILCVIKIQHDETQKNETIKTMTTEHAANINALQNELKVNKQNAEAMQKEITKAQNGLRRPESVYTERIIQGQDVVRVVQEKIATGDSTLPPLALADTDRTVVAAQPDNKDVPVGVYKINNYRNWEMGVGAGVHEGDFYIPISIQRNYSKSHSIEAEVHVSPRDKTINGGSIKYNIHF